MTHEYIDMEGGGGAYSDFEQNDREAHLQDLARREHAYKLVFYTLISPKELDDDLVIHFDKPELKTQKDKRAAKINEIDVYKNAYLKTYRELCELGVMQPSFEYLAQNGFGLGAGDLLDDEAIDALIAKDEQIDQEKAERKSAEEKEGVCANARAYRSSIEN